MTFTLITVKKSSLSQFEGWFNFQESLTFLSTRARASQPASKKNQPARPLGWGGHAVAPSRRRLGHVVQPDANEARNQMTVENVARLAKRTVGCGEEQSAPGGSVRGERAIFTRLVLGGGGGGGGRLGCIEAKFCK